MLGVDLVVIWVVKHDKYHKINERQVQLVRSNKEIRV